MRVIKRYANRKLYDSTESRYVTLDEIASMIEAGDEIQIIDNKTKEDLTALTMAQILVEKEKRQKRSGSLPGLRELLQHGGELISKRITEPVTHIATSVEESAKKLVKLGEERVFETREQFQHWIDHNALLLEELQDQIDERIRHALTSLDPLAPLQSKLKRLHRRLEAVEAHLGLKPEAEEAEEEVLNEADQD